MKAPAEKKAFWFAFNTADWLSDKRVRLMSLAERGAYIGLLATAWQEERPGTLTADEDEFRRLAEMSPEQWQVSARVLLAVFPLSECGGYRYNKRLLEEVGKRAELSEKKAEAGRKSAEIKAAKKEEADRMATQRQQNANTNPTPVEIQATGVPQNGNQLQPQLQLQAKAGGGGPAADQPPLKAEKPKRELVVAAHTDPDDLQDVAHSPLAKPEAFAVILKATGYPGLDAERYRSQIAAKSEGVTRTASQWRSRIIEFVNNDFTAGKLLMAPVLLPNQVASNAGFVTQGSGIPNKEDYLKPTGQQPAGQYSGQIK